MTSLHLGIRFGSGGEGRVVSELFKFLPAEGIECLGAFAGPDDVERKTSGQVRLFTPESATAPQRLMRARSVIQEVLRTKRPEIIACHFALYAFPILDKLRSARFVMHFHGPWAAESQQEGAGSFAANMRGRLERSVYDRADRVIVLSAAFGQLATERYGIPPEKLRLIPGAVDVDRFHVPGSRADARHRLGLPQDRPILLSVRRLAKRMGLGGLIAAMPATLQASPKALLLIGGEGLILAELQAEVAKRNLSNSVRFLGYVKEDDLPYLYRAADVNVVPTLALEGFGLVAAEAMAAGTPSMVTPIGGLPDIVSGLAPGLIFRSSAVADLASGLIAALRGNMQLPDSEACVNHIRANFTSTLMAERTAAVYRELV